MPKCKECVHYKPFDEEQGFCFGVLLHGDRDAHESEKCRADHFTPHEKK